MAHKVSSLGKRCGRLTRAQLSHQIWGSAVLEGIGENPWTLSYTLKTMKPVDFVHVEYLSVLTSSPSLLMIEVSIFRMPVLMVLGGGSTVIPMLMALERLGPSTTISFLFWSCFCRGRHKKIIQVLFIQVEGKRTCYNIFQKIYKITKFVWTKVAEFRVNFE